MKWSFPHFDYKGIFCAMASFKSHCTFGFWKGSMLKSLPRKEGEEAMGQLGRISSMKDLPPDKIMLNAIREAMKLNDEGIKPAPRKKPAKRQEMDIPDYFLKAIKKDKKALTTFVNFSYSNKKEYVDWVREAKTEATRNSRLDTAIEWMSEGKVRNWKYLKKK